MESCCNTTYQGTFDDKRAKKELKEYEASGIKENSQALYQLLQLLDLRDKSMLEIGGGIGSLIFESFTLGLKTAQYVDISEAYFHTFKSALKARNLEDKVAIHLGDFVVLEEKVQKADLVVLDKVICCYEDYEALVQNSTAKAASWYAITIPKDSWWIKILFSYFIFLKRLKKDFFRPYIHKHRLIFDQIHKAGFQLKEERKNFMWKSFLFERI
ncbi:MAG: hypothetical protein AAF696_09950 [Bacteroidota bacterium]